MKKLVDVKTIEFGDFQTPIELARDIVACLKLKGITAKSVIEPNCGTGSFIFAAIEHYPKAEIHGMDINTTYIKKLIENQLVINSINRIELSTQDFFQFDSLLVPCHSPSLIPMFVFIV